MPLEATDTLSGSRSRAENLAMADAVSLVRAYLHVNGYFTVTEYPVLERLRGGGHRMVTDLDVLAFRFGGAGPVRINAEDTGRPVVLTLQEPDPMLGRRREEPDMIVAEVKEGRAELNRGARDPRVLQAALVRFGCCSSDGAVTVANTLLERGEARTDRGHRVRVLAFGATVPSASSLTYTAITLGHVVRFLRHHLKDNWAIVRNAQITDPALRFLSLLEKAADEPGAGDPPS